MKLLRERLYDGTCFLLSNRASGRSGAYREPNPELSFRNFAEGLVARAVAHMKTAPPNPAPLTKVEDKPCPADQKKRRGRPKRGV
jgi:hypothetical protein